MSTPTNDPAALMTEAGFSYPGTPGAAMRILLDKLGEAQTEAKTNREQYSALVSELHAALSGVPREIQRSTPSITARLAAWVGLWDALQKTAPDHVAVQAQIRASRARLPELSAQEDEDEMFIWRLTERAAGEEVPAEPAVVRASLEYFTALNRGDQVAIQACAVAWNRACTAALGDDAPDSTGVLT